MEWIAQRARRRNHRSTSTRYASRLPWIAAAGLAIVAAGVLASPYRATRPAELKPLVRLDVDLGPDVSLTAPLGGADAILSPDGTRLVYVSQGRLFTRGSISPRLPSWRARKEPIAPFFSPDGQWVAFFAGTKAEKDFGGRRLSDRLVRRPRWPWRGRRQLGRGWQHHRERSARTCHCRGFPPAGGAPTPVTELGQGEVTAIAGRKFCREAKRCCSLPTHSCAGFDDANIEVMSLADHRRKTLQSGRHLRPLLARQAATWCTSTKERCLPCRSIWTTLAVRGTPSPVLEQVAYSPGHGSAQFDFSRSGTLVYESGGAEGGGLFTVQWLEGGQDAAAPGQGGQLLNPRLSPDGPRLACLRGGHLDLRMAAGHHDAPDFQRRRQSSLEPRRPLHRVPAGREACSGPAPMARASPNR